MSLLFNVVFANECTSTHHKLALDALRHLQDEDAELWRNLFLYYFDSYLDGAKAPDRKFKDFRNHVLHVQENYWGGALNEADKWYRETVRAFRAGAWSKAVYSAGVLSHYFTDPFMPFHTGQSEEEVQIHRAVEWSIAKSYEELQNILEEQGGYPKISPLEGEDWLAEMIRAGAELGNAHYQLLIDHYDIEAGVKNPELGMDQDAKDAVADQLGLATVGLARVLERVFDDADVEPPKMGITLAGYLATLTVPIGWVTRRIADAKDRKVVQAMYDELQRYGRVTRTLPDDDREVRELHAEEVLEVPVSELESQPLGEIGAKHGQGKPSRAVAHRPVVCVDGHPPEEIEVPCTGALPARVYLKMSDNVVDAPSIGPKTARRLERVGIHTVEDLLHRDPDDVAKQVRSRYVDADLIRDWQDQAALVCRISNLRGHDAQILVECDFRTPEQIAAADAEDLAGKATAFAKSAAGKRILGSSSPPDRDEVEDWILWATNAHAA